MVALTIALALIALTQFAISSATLVGMLHAWRTPEHFAGTGFPALQMPRFSFSLIMPCRDEEESVMAVTLSRLLEQTHPAVEIIISVGDDDVETVGHARRLAARYPHQVRVSVNTDAVKNKPRQLNSSLRMARNDIVGIIDAESLTHRRLLSHIDSTFAVHDADIVQGAVHLINYRSSWFTLRNCLEYRIWFRSRLHGHAASGFIPLGGNTVFIRRALLEDVGGWDGDCLAEDCEIGVRLSAMRKKTVCVYDKELTTLEEAPEQLSAFIKQRTRWALGFMQVMAKGEWRKLPTRPQRISAWWTLVQQYAMAFTGLVLPLGVVTAFIFKAQAAVALLTYLPLLPAALIVAYEVIALREFGRDMELDIGARDYTRLIISTPFYQALLAISALRALYKFARGNFAWEKTAHTGAHLDMADHLDSGQPATSPREIDLTGGVPSPVHVGAEVIDLTDAALSVRTRRR